ncbi:MAG: nucleoside hydrolase-like domain-containing protein, partial [Planctomycetota bacterium]
GPGTSGAITDPDDISAMAGFLLLSNEFDVRGISIACTSRKEVAAAPDQARWANDYLGAAYRADVKHLNARIGGYPEEITFVQSSIKGIRFSESEDYTRLDAFPTIQALRDELVRTEGVLHVLCWGPTSEAAVVVKHCISTGRSELLAKMRIIAHWTNSPLHNAGGADNVANRNFDRAACDYLKGQAQKGVVKYYECGAIGQHGIVSGAPTGNAYYDQFKRSRLGRIFVEGKYQHGKVDWSDAATYMVLLGTYGVGLKDLSADGTNSAAREQKNEEAFKAHSKRLHDELLRRSNAAAGDAGESQAR